MCFWNRGSNNLVQVALGCVLWPKDKNSGLLWFLLHQPAKPMEESSVLNKIKYEHELQYSMRKIGKKVHTFSIPGTSTGWIPANPWESKLYM